LRRDIARAAEYVVRLVEAELADVSRDRRLRHSAPGAGQRVQELVLRPDASPRDDARNQPLALLLLERTGLSLHTERINMRPFRVSRPSLRGTLASMLRRLMWTGLYASLAAAATLAARKTASTIWRVATGEEPPVRR
jgi:hypothetical protein